MSPSWIVNYIGSASNALSENGGYGSAEESGSYKHVYGNPFDPPLSSAHNGSGFSNIVIIVVLIVVVVLYLSRSGSGPSKGTVVDVEKVVDTHQGSLSRALSVVESRKGLDFEDVLRCARDEINVVSSLNDVGDLDTRCSLKMRVDKSVADACSQSKFPSILKKTELRGLPFMFRYLLRAYKDQKDALSLDGVQDCCITDDDVKRICESILVLCGCDKSCLRFSQKSLTCIGEYMDNVVA